MVVKIYNYIIKKNKKFIKNLKYTINNFYIITILYKNLVLKN